MLFPYFYMHIGFYKYFCIRISWKNNGVLMTDTNTSLLFLIIQVTLTDFIILRPGLGRSDKILFQMKHKHIFCIKQQNIYVELEYSLLLKMVCVCARAHVSVRDI